MISTPLIPTKIRGQRLKSVSGSSEPTNERKPSCARSLARFCVMSRFCFRLGYAHTGASHFGSRTRFLLWWPILFLWISIWGRKDKMRDRESDGLTVRMQNGVIGHSPCASRRLSDTVQTSCTVLMAEVWSGCLAHRKHSEDLCSCIKSIKMERPITTCCRSQWIVLCSDVLLAPSQCIHAALSLGVC